MPLNLRNLDYIKNLSFKEAPDFGTKLGELLQGLQQGVGNIESQTNSNATGPPSHPPAVNALNVQGQNGHFSIAIHDTTPVYRGVQYFVDHASNPQFTDAHTIDMGTSRNHNVFLGNVGRYFRAYSAYPGSPPGPHVYHGSQATPKMVLGGGTVGGPAFTTSQSSGTGMAGQTGQGPGTVPFRAVNGGPPVR